MKHVIIGSGAAGISAAITIRKLRPEDEILIISTDSTVYSRCMLHLFISGARDLEGISFVPPDFFETNKLRCLSSTTVTGLDIASKRVLFDGGEESYDKLLIATGSVSTLPPIPGLRQASCVSTLCDIHDANMIKQKAADAKDIVVIGAGLVGLDAAYGITGSGKKITFVERASTVLPTCLDAKAAAAYQSKFEEAGCTFILNSSIKSVTIDSTDTLCNVELDDGQLINVDLLVIAAGVRPAISFLKDSNITKDGKISVNKFLETGVDSVYAAGDVTGLSESWPGAKRQGEIAGTNMCGIASDYDEIITRQNTVNFFGIQSLSVGRFDPIQGDIEHIREDRNKYQKVVTNNSVPVGVILMGDISRSGFWQHMIKNRIPIKSASGNLWKTSYANSYGINENGEYQWSDTV